MRSNPHRPYAHARRFEIVPTLNQSSDGPVLSPVEVHVTLNGGWERDVWLDRSITLGEHDEPGLQGSIGEVTAA